MGGLKSEGSLNNNSSLLLLRVRIQMEHESEQNEIRELASLIATESKKKREGGEQKKNQLKEFKELITLDMDISDMLKTLSHQKKAMTKDRWQCLEVIHRNLEIKQEDFKYFMIVATQTNFVILENTGYYQSLKHNIQNYPNHFFSCIDKDVPRTLPATHPFYDQLRNILCSYAMRNPSVHYCQGMNYLVAFLLMNDFSEEQCFWFMVQLIQNILKPDYFKNLTIVSITTQIFTDIFQIQFPQLAIEIENLGMDPSMFLVSWYVCLFSKGFINSVSQYLFQYIILNCKRQPIGYILLKASMAVVTSILISQRPFQFQKDYAKFKQALQKSVHEISLVEIQQAFNFFDFHIDHYLKLEQHYLEKRNENLMEQIEKELKESKLVLTPCKPSDPICMHRIQIQKRVGQIQEVLILKTSDSIKDLIDENYFPKRVNRSSHIAVFKNIQECLIAHHRHICSYKKMEQMNIIPNTSFGIQQSTYYPVSDITSQQFPMKLQGEVFSRYSNVEDIYNRFSAYFLVQELSDDEDINSDPKVKMNKNKKEELETSIEEVLCRKNRYARVVLDEELDTSLDFNDFHKQQHEQKKEQLEIMQMQKSGNKKKNFLNTSFQTVIQKASLLRSRKSQEDSSKHLTDS